MSQQVSLACCVETQKAVLLPCCLWQVYDRVLSFVEERISVQLAPSSVVGSSYLATGDPTATLTMLLAPTFTVRPTDWRFALSIPHSPLLHACLNVCALS